MLSNLDNPHPATPVKINEFTYLLDRSKDLDPLMKRVGPAHYVLLGEASHGTHEYYTWRAAITKRLIMEKGFRFIAVEGDWPDCYRLNRYIKGYADQDKEPIELLKTFNRWPTWMWANWELVSLISWSKDYNASQPANKRVGFYGLDVYSLWESMESMMEYLSAHDLEAAQYVKNALTCFEPFGEDEHRYAQSQKHSMDLSCQEAVISLLTAIRKKTPIYDHDPEAALNMEQNAVIAVNAERYYRHMMGFDVNTWNLRDQHMMETLNRLMQFYGTEAKAIVWAHNTHVGDARFTDMTLSGDLNIGQLVREEKGEKDVVLVGFGSYAGRVIAGSGWGTPMENLSVPEAKENSIEEVLHLESENNKLLIFRDTDHIDLFSKTMPHRAIGVVYRPAYERRGNYVPTILNRRYDAFVYIDKTSAVHPLHMQPDGHKIPETYPFEY